MLVSLNLIIALVYMAMKGNKIDEFERLIGFKLPQSVIVEKYHVQTFPESSRRAYWILMDFRNEEIQEIAKKLNLKMMPVNWGDLGSYPPEAIVSWWWDSKLNDTKSFSVYHKTKDNKWSRITIIEDGNQAWCYLSEN